MAQHESFQEKAPRPRLPYMGTNVEPKRGGAPLRCSSAAVPAKKCALASALGGGALKARKPGHVNPLGIKRCV